MSKYLLAAAILIAPIIIHSSDTPTQLTVYYDPRESLCFKDDPADTYCQQDVYIRKSVTIYYAQQLDLKKTKYSSMNMTPVVLMIDHNNFNTLLFKYETEKTLKPFTAMNSQMIKPLLKLVEKKKIPVFNITYQENQQNTTYYIAEIIQYNWFKNANFNCRHQYSLDLSSLTLTLPKSIKNMMNKIYPSNNIEHSSEDNSSSYESKNELSSSTEREKKRKSESSSSSDSEKDKKKETKAKTEIEQKNHDIPSSDTPTQLTVYYDEGSPLRFHYWSTGGTDTARPKKMTIDYAQKLDLYTGYNLNMTPVVLMILKNKNALLFEYKVGKGLLPFAAININMVNQLENVPSYETPAFNITDQKNPDKITYYITRKIITNYENYFDGLYYIWWTPLSLSFLKTRVVIRYLTIAVIILSSVFLKVWG